MIHAYSILGLLFTLMTASFLYKAIPDSYGDSVYVIDAKTLLDDGAPTALLKSPINEAMGVSTDRKITVVFSREMDPLTITTATFLVRGPGSSSVLGKVDMDSSHQIANFIPLKSLASNTFITVTITTGAADRNGNSMAGNYEWSFITTWMQSAL